MIDEILTEKEAVMASYTVLSQNSSQVNGVIAIIFRYIVGLPITFEVGTPEYKSISLRMTTAAVRPYQTCKVATPLIPKRATCFKYSARDFLGVCVHIPILPAN
jgi:hypothetical protein